MSTKKILIAALLVFFAMPNLALAVTSDDLEQIPSPDYLPFYKVLEKRGGSLWGHRLISKDEMKRKLSEKKSEKKESVDLKKTEKETVKIDKKEAKAAGKEAKKLEKIATPSHIKFFDGIRQVGNALWGFVKNSWAYGLGRITKDNAACVATAVGARDAAVRSAIVANDAALLAAHDARSACQQTAFTEETANEMALALVECNKAFEMSRKTAWKGFLSSRDSAWKQFREELKKCGQAANAALLEADGDTVDVVEALDDEGLDEVTDDEADIEAETENETGSSGASE